MRSWRKEIFIEPTEITNGAYYITPINSLISKCASIKVTNMLQYFLHMEA